MPIKPATPLDLDLLSNFGYQLHLIEKEFEPTLTYSKTECIDRYSKQLKNPLALLLITEVNSIPAGYLYAHIGDDQVCNLEVVYISPEYRGKSLATELINECITWIKEKKVSKIRTEIFEGNIPSIKAFEKIGFVKNTESYLLDLNN